MRVYWLKLRNSRILQVISSSAPSGAERHLCSLSRHLTDRGHTVEVVCPAGGWLPQELRDKGLQVREMEMHGAGWFRTAGYMMNRVKEGGIDLIHSHLTRATYFAHVSSLFRGVPAVSTVHIANHDQIYKRIARRNNRLIAVSNFVRGMLHGRDVPDRFIDTVYNGTEFTEFESFNPSGVKAELGIPADRKLVGLVGRVCHDKGHPIMIEAMQDVLKEAPQHALGFCGKNRCRV